MLKLYYMIEDILQWIDANIDKPLRIEDISVKSGYSKWHLQRVFYQHKKKTIACYIRDRKLDLAVNDLISTNKNILTISIEYGFGSQQSFTRIFSKKYKIPPSRYRYLYSSSLRH
ncbi:AraC family multidrug resistance transcriptional activator [Enterobacter sp. BIGb0383]|uniref:helix-turn-helix domain-containing protein n=1 Tax=unclassified Enterobacter TaxID=2608935 RepID=UPI000F494BF1|nr:MULTISPECIES: helix-turn-helix domain-containing protein [unclassified Enterobacter]ROP62988.1 AraC family multidrug resistance transcriptional activator [Enterobacter sp. BIGb0383]ROS13149.1 AraC family multidrug resistance transcriptional activator [Enterobacter sp. BIGb0359]